MSCSTRLRQAEGQSGARDADAAALIAQHVARQPAAPYYMAQAIVVQQDALAEAQMKIQELERQLEERPAGGLPGRAVRRWSGDGGDARRRRAQSR